MAGLSMNSMATGMMPAAMMADTHWPAVSLELKSDQHRPRAFRRAQDAYRRFRDDAELALRAHDQAHEIVAGRIEMGAADVDHLAVHQHHLQAQDVVGGDPILEAVRAARVHADVAGKRAGELAGRIGRVEEALLLHRFADAEIGDADLDGCAVRFMVSMPSTRFMRDTVMTSASSAGSAPPDSDVPAPRATTLMSLAWQ